MHVSLICFAGKDAGLPTRLNGEDAPRINSDLTSGTVDLSRAGRLPQNIGVAFMGDIKNGAFDIPGDQAREWLRLPANPNGAIQRRRTQTMDQRHGPYPLSIG